MRNKDCPSCGADVPQDATRCKECFHDFDDEPTRRTWSGPLVLLGSVAAMAVVGVLTLMVIVNQPLEERILVDEDTRSVIWTRKFASSVQTERLMWDDIIKLEYVIKANGSFEIAALTVKGEREVIQEDRRPLKSEASKYSALMEKPMELVDKTSGFHKMDE